MVIDGQRCLWLQRERAQRLLCVSFFLSTFLSTCFARESEADIFATEFRGCFELGFRTASPSHGRSPRTPSRDTRRDAATPRLAGAPKDASPRLPRLQQNLTAPLPSSRIAGKLLRAARRPGGCGRAVGTPAALLCARRTEAAGLRCRGVQLHPLIKGVRPGGWHGGNTQKPN